MPKKHNFKEMLFWQNLKCVVNAHVSCIKCLKIVSGSHGNAFKNMQLLRLFYPQRFPTPPVDYAKYHCSYFVYFLAENTDNSACRASTLRRSASVPIVDMLGPQRIEPLPPNSRDNLYRSSAGPGYGGLPYKDRKLHGDNLIMKAQVPTDFYNSFSDRFIMFPKDSYQSSLGRIDFPPSSQMIMPYNRYTGSEYYTNQRLYIDDDMKRTYAPMNSPSALQPSTYSGFNSRYNSVRNYHTFSSTIPRSNKGGLKDFYQFFASCSSFGANLNTKHLNFNFQSRQMNTKIRI